MTKPILEQDVAPDLGATIDAMTEACHRAAERGEDVVALLTAVQDDSVAVSSPLHDEIEPLLKDVRLRGSRRDVIDVVRMHFEVERAEPRHAAVR